MADIVRNFQNEFGRRAASIDGEYRKHRASIIADGNLSDAGKRAAMTDANTRRKTAVDKLQAEAGDWAKRERTEAYKDLATQRAAFVDGRRRVLGDGLTADLARRRLALLTPDELAAAVETAPDAWHKTLYGELVDLELRERSNRGDHAATGALVALGLSLPAEIQELETALQEFERTGDSLTADLDVEGHRGRIGAAYGVNPEYVPTMDTE